MLCSSRHKQIQGNNIINQSYGWMNKGAYCNMYYQEHIMCSFWSNSMDYIMYVYAYCIALYCSIPHRLKQMTVLKG